MWRPQGWNRLGMFKEWNRGLCRWCAEDKGDGARAGTCSALETEKGLQLVLKRVMKTLKNPMQRSN